MRPRGLFSVVILASLTVLRLPCFSSAFKSPQHIPDLMKFYWLNMPFKQQAEGVCVFLSGKKGGMEISLEARPQKRNVSPQHPQHSTLKSHPPKLSTSCSDLLQGDPWGNLAAPQWGPPSERALFLANRLCSSVCSVQFQSQEYLSLSGNKHVNLSHTHKPIYLDKQC